MPFSPRRGVDELLGFLEEEAKIWVIADYKARRYSSKDARNFLVSAFDRHSRAKFISTYVNCMEPPCGLYDGHPDLVRLQEYNEAVRLNLNDADAYYDRGNVYARLGVSQRAIDDYDEAIRLDPQHFQAYGNRGIAYFNVAEPQQAIKDFGQAIRVNPLDASAYENRAITNLNLGELHKAIDDFSEAIRLDPPDDGRVYKYRARVYTLLRNDAAAQHDIDQAIELGVNPTSLKASIEKLKDRR